jgi:large subunit ribosomal protein L31e
MSQELERVYTINLGKVLLSPNNQRAKRAINMIKEFARHHMKTEEIKIEETLSHLIWKRGIRHPPRKIRVSMTKTDEGFVLVSPYEEEIEEATKPKLEKKTPEVEEKPESESKEVKTSEIKEEPVKKEPLAKKPQTKESKSKPKPKKSKTKDSKKSSTKKQSTKKKSK